MPPCWVLVPEWCSPSQVTTSCGGRNPSEYSSYMVLMLTEGGGGGRGGVAEDCLLLCVIIFINYCILSVLFD